MGLCDRFVKLVVHSNNLNGVHIPLILMELHPMNIKASTLKVPSNYRPLSFTGTWPQPSRAKAWTGKRRFHAVYDRPKIRRERAAVQPHAKTCECFACKSYRALILALNPARATEFESSTFPLYLMSLNKLPDYVHRRRMLAQTLGKSNFTIR